MNGIRQDISSLRSLRASEYYYNANKGQQSQHITKCMDGITSQVDDPLSQHSELIVEM